MMSREYFSESMSWLMTQEQMDASSYRAMKNTECVKEYTESSMKSETQLL